MLDKMKTVPIIARTLFILCIPLLLFTAGIAVAFNSRPLYEYGFEKYDVASTTGLAATELTKTAEALISYFNSGDEYIELTVEKDGIEFELFTREEAIHFRDVKGLVRLDYGILLGTAVYVLGYAGIYLYRRNNTRKIALNVLTGCGVTLGLMLVLWVGSLSDFDGLFHRFHLLAFSNEYWSAEGYMLELFPGEFWYDATLFCAIETAAMAVILGFTAAGYLFFSGKGLHFHGQMS